MSTTTVTAGTNFKRERINNGITIGVFVTIIVLLYGYPILNLLNVSLRTSAEFIQNPNGLATSLHFANYVEVFTGNAFVRNFFNSIYYLVAANAVTLSTSALAAFVISRGYVRWANVFYLLFLAGIFLPDALIPQFRLINSLGLFNNPIGYILLKTNPGIIMLLLVGYYRTIPREFDEAAAIDGAGQMRYLFTFVFPMSTPVLASAVILFSVGIWNDIIGTTIFLTSPRFYPVIRALFAFVGQYGTDWPPLSAAVFIVALPLILLFLFFQKYIISGIVSGGVKG